MPEVRDKSNGRWVEREIVRELNVDLEDASSVISARGAFNPRIPVEEIALIRANKEALDRLIFKLGKLLREQLHCYGSAHYH